MKNNFLLKDFEVWLYSQTALADQLDKPMLLDLFAFNYNQPGAFYVFRNTFLPYLDQDDFLNWKVKINLRDLIENCPTRDRILSDFERLGQQLSIPKLYWIGNYLCVPRRTRLVQNLPRL